MLSGSLLSRFTGGGGTLKSIKLHKNSVQNVLLRPSVFFCAPGWFFGDTFAPTSDQNRDSNQKWGTCVYISKNSMSVRVGPPKSEPEIDKRAMQTVLRV